MDVEEPPPTNPPGAAEPPPPLPVEPQQEQIPTNPPAVPVLAVPVPMAPPPPPPQPPQGSFMDQLRLIELAMFNSVQPGGPVPRIIALEQDMNVSPEEGDSLAARVARVYAACVAVGIEVGQ